MARVVQTIAQFNNTGTKGVEGVVLPYTISYRDTAPVDEGGTYVAVEVVAHQRRGNLGPQVAWAETSRLGRGIENSAHNHRRDEHDKPGADRSEVVGPHMRYGSKLGRTGGG
jgi:NADPH-dependent ferric siderophore reductase